MSKYANAGELRTPVKFVRMERTVDAEGNAHEREINVFGRDDDGRERVAMCKWVNAHGTEVFESMRLDLREPATLTMRYSPLINKTLTLYRGNDPQPYEIISSDNVEERNAWLELRVQRMGAAR